MKNTAKKTEQEQETAEQKIEQRKISIARLARRVRGEILYATQTLAKVSERVEALRTREFDANNRENIIENDCQTLQESDLDELETVMIKFNDQLEGWLKYGANYDVCEDS
jgi:hypothetical protein